MLFLESFTGIGDLMNTYSVISGINVSAMELIEKNVSIKELKEEIKSPLQEMRGTLLIDGKNINELSEETILQNHENLQVEVQSMYDWEIGWGIYEVNDNVMVSKRSN